MPLRKPWFYAVLAAVLTCTAIGSLSRHGKEFDVSQMDTGANRPSLAAEFQRKSGLLSADLFPIQSFPVQSKSAKNLAVGRLLVASRNLGDPQFAKTVILLARYDAHVALGLILNRRTNVPLSRALQNLKAAKDRSDPVYVGGPMEIPAAFALFQSPAKLEGAENIFDGVYMITAKPLFEQTISARPDPKTFHVYLGYAGWTQDQLRQEVALGAWFIFPGEATTVFNSDPDSLWEEMIRKTELQMARGEAGEEDMSAIQLSSDLKYVYGFRTKLRPLR